MSKSLRVWVQAIRKSDSGRGYVRHNDLSRLRFVILFCVSQVKYLGNTVIMSLWESSICYVGTNSDVFIFKTIWLTIKSSWNQCHLNWFHIPTPKRKMQTKIHKHKYKDIIGHAHFAWNCVYMRVSESRELFRNVYPPEP